MSKTTYVLELTRKEAELLHFVIGNTAGAGAANIVYPIYEAMSEAWPEIAKSNESWFGQEDARSWINVPVKE